MLIKLTGTKKAMEIGVYTGYSLLATALAIPQDGTILAMDINRDSYELGLPCIENAGVAHKIKIVHSSTNRFDANEPCAMMCSGAGELGPFDFVFVDADKDNYLIHDERLMKPVTTRSGTGPIVLHADATSCSGSNKTLAADTCIETCQLPVGDGITLCRRVK